MTATLLYDSVGVDLSNPTVKSGTFGHLVKLATPILMAYHGDLYHDAMWINEHVTGTSMVFYWAINEAGTSIDTDRFGPNICHYRRNKYRVTLAVSDRGKATIDIDKWNDDANDWDREV